MSSLKTSKEDKWRVALSNDAVKFYKKVPVELAKRINSALDKLAENPLMAGVRPVKTERGVYRIRISNVRLLFGLNKKARIIEVFAIVPRSEAYKRK